MNMTEKAKWADVTDGAVANTIFGDYGIRPTGNLDDDSPAHTSDKHSLMQRATDAQFLRLLARRSGKLFRVFCTRSLPIPPLGSSIILSNCEGMERANSIQYLEDYQHDWH